MFWPDNGREGARHSENNIGLTHFLHLCCNGRLCPSELHLAPDLLQSVQTTAHQHQMRDASGKQPGTGTSNGTISAHTCGDSLSRVKIHLSCGCQGGLNSQGNRIAVARGHGDGESLRDGDTCISYNGSKGPQSQDLSSKPLCQLPSLNDFTIS